MARNRKNEKPQHQDYAGKVSVKRRGSSSGTGKKKAAIRDDMVPVSLVFEACFHNERGMKKN